MISVKLPTQEEFVAYKRRYPFPMRDIIEQGRNGFRRNKNNPFPPTSDRAREWQRGYNKEYYRCLNQNIRSLENKESS